MLLEYSDKIKPYLSDIIINLKEFETWKIQVTIAINFISSKHAKEERVIQAKCHNIKFMSYNNSNKVVDELFDSRISWYRGTSETLMEGSQFVFDSVQLMYYKCYKENFRRHGPYIDSPNWIKKTKATTNPKNKDDKCFQYAVTVALNYGEIESHPERVLNTEPVINKYKWKGKNNPLKIHEKVAANKLSTLWRGKTTKHHSDWLLLLKLHSFF